jgi:hypothetical protein
MAERWPLPPLAPVTASFGRQLEVVHGTFLMPTYSSLYFKAKKWPLPALALVTDVFDHLLQAIFNIQALMPLWRPFVSRAASSRLTAPSGFVPDDCEVEYTARWMSGGKGASLDCFFVVSSKVPSAKCKDLSIILFFFSCLHVKCIPTADNPWIPRSFGTAPVKKNGHIPHSENFDAGYKSRDGKLLSADTITKIDIHLLLEKKLLIYRCLYNTRVTLLS